MNSGSAIIGVILIAICIAPFIVMHYKRVKRENRMLQSLREIAQQNNCNISQYEFCGDFVLGLDEVRRFVFFFKQKKEEAISQYIDLSEIHTCRMAAKTIYKKNGLASTAFTESVNLSFLPLSRSKNEERFELYNEDTNAQLSGELQIAEKWSKQINDHLRSKK